jgi:hypothetical protein
LPTKFADIIILLTVFADEEIFAGSDGSTTLLELLKFSHHANLSTAGAQS